MSGFVITPSHIAFFGIVSIMIDEYQRISLEESMQIMCFLGDHLNFNSCTQYPRLDELLHDFGLVFSSWQVVKTKLQGTTVFMESLHNKMQFDSIDKLTDFLDYGTSVFQNSKVENPNGLCSPACVSPTSIIGMFMRSVIVSCASASFGSTASLFEKWVLFERTHSVSQVPSLIPRQQSWRQKQQSGLPFTVGRSNRDVSVLPQCAVPLEPEANLLYVLRI
jgi:hypothetical protein